MKSIETAFNRNLVRIYTAQYKWTDKTEFKRASEKILRNRHSCQQAELWVMTAYMSLAICS